MPREDFLYSFKVGLRDATESYSDNMRERRPPAELWAAGLMPETFSEFRDVSVGEPLRQGDVLEAVDAAASMWTRHLVVITADCDFAHGKHKGRVTCVPVLTYGEYLVELQLPTIKERLIRKPIDAVVSIVRESRANGITHERMREWASEEDAHTIVQILELNGNEAAEAVAALQAIRLLDAPAISLKAGVSALVESQLLGTSARKRVNVEKDVMNWLRQPYASPPGDAHFISSIAAGHDMSYFLYLRHLEQIWESEISTGPRHKEVKYRRISRLQDRFIHSVVQKFALVFMPIGLPVEYEEVRDMYAESLGELLK